MQHTRLRRSAAVFALVALAATACGGGDGDPVASESEATGSESEVMGSESEVMGSESETASEAEVTDAANGTLDLAYILPETGQLAFLGPPMIGGVTLAVEDINAAGGVLGQQVSLKGEAGQITKTLHQQVRATERQRTCDLAFAMARNRHIRVARETDDGAASRSI